MIRIRSIGSSKSKQEACERQCMLTRGKAYDIIRNCITDTKLNITYDKVKILQQIVDIVMELPACWPDGLPMTQTIRLDSDLICKRDMINALDRFVDKEPEDSDKNIICCILQEKIHAAT